MSLENVRRQYARAKLERDQLASDPYSQLQSWLHQALEAKLSDDPTAMTLSTVAANGQPSSRIVLLKHLDERGLVFYTNLGSRKAQEIATNPRVCAHFSWLGLERQAVIYGQAEKLSLAEVGRYFLSRPRDSQLGAWASAQSQPIASRQLLEQAFQQMKQRFAEGKIPVPDFWGGFRIRIDNAEFWQGGENRLHDRFWYQPDEQQGWQLQRLQP